MAKVHAPLSVLSKVALTVGVLGAALLPDCLFTANSGFRCPSALLKQIPDEVFVKKAWKQEVLATLKKLHLIEDVVHQGELYYTGTKLPSMVLLFEDVLANKDIYEHNDDLKKVHLDPFVMWLLFPTTYPLEERFAKALQEVEKEYQEKMQITSNQAKLAITKNFVAQLLVLNENESVVATNLFRIPSDTPMSDRKVFESVMRSREWCASVINRAVSSGLLHRSGNKVELTSRLLRAQFMEASEVDATVEAFAQWLLWPSDYENPLKLPEPEPEAHEAEAEESEEGSSDAVLAELLKVMNAVLEAQNEVLGATRKLGERVEGIEKALTGIDVKITLPKEVVDTINATSSNVLSVAQQTASVDASQRVMIHELRSLPTLLKAMQARSTRGDLEAHLLTLDQHVKAVAEHKKNIEDAILLIATEEDGNQGKSG